jgi:uncharacterized repeat protein (TIGR04138 family)
MNPQSDPQPPPGKPGVWEVEQAILKASQQLAGIYRLDAFRFVLAAVGHTHQLVKEQRHITGEELCRGLVDQAQESFGPLAVPVLSYWGINSTADVGTIVFALIDQGVLGKSEQDSKMDFENLFDLKREINETYNYFR